MNVLIGSVLMASGLALELIADKQSNKNTKIKLAYIGFLLGASGVIIIFK